MPDGKRLLVLSDETGEVELWTVAANGVVALAGVDHAGPDFLEDLVGRGRMAIHLT